MKTFYAILFLYQYCLEHNPISLVRFGFRFVVKVIWKEELNEIAGDEFQVDEIVYRLLEQGLISVDDGICSINPEALPNIVEFLRKSRIVW